MKKNLITASPKSKFKGTTIMDNNEPPNEAQLVDTHENDDGEITKEKIPFTIFQLKLLNGESVIGKTYESTTQIYTDGSIRMHHVMAIKKMMVQGPDGISEVLTIAPWMEASDLIQPVVIPLNHILGMAYVKPEMIVKYGKMVLSCLIKEAIAAKQQAEQITNMLNNMDQEFIEDDINNPESLFQQSVEVKHEPDRITPESLMRDGMSGNLKDVESELQKEEDIKNSDSEPEPSYKIEGITYH
jgi:hypothetical protein